MLRDEHAQNPMTPHLCRRLPAGLAILVAITVAWSGCTTMPMSDARPDELQPPPRVDKWIPDPETWPRTFPNAYGPDIVLERPASNIISLQPNVAEMLVAIGGDSHLLAVDKYTDYPPQAAMKPKIGDILSPDYEMIVSLQPDLAITSRGTPEDVLKKLRDLDLQVLGVDPQSLDEVFSCMRMFGRIIGNDQMAAQVTAQLQRRREAVRQRVRQAVARSGRPSTMFVLSTEPLFVAGTGSFIASVIEEAGGQHAYRALGGRVNQPWPQVSKETILAAAPEVLIISTMDAGVNQIESAQDRLAQLRKDAAWAQVPAVGSGRVYVIDDDLITIPGPRLVEGLERMAALLHPPSDAEPE